MRRWRKIVAILLVPVVCCLALAVLCMIFEEQFIFFPSRYPQGDWNPAGLKFEDAQFTASDGTPLHGWYVPHENPRAVVLFSHGNAGNLSDRAEMLRALNGRAGVSVMIYDYRGYGKSGGRPAEKGLLLDARAARAWLARRAGVAETRIVLMGRSLGGAVAVDLAATDGARGLVLESTFTSIAEMAAVHYPWLPMRSLIRNRFDSLAKIGRYRGPLLVSHGDSDRVVPYEMGRRLLAAANEPKTFLTIEGGDHNDPQPPDYDRQLVEFLDGLP
ncbi:MAG: alpha/beta hydrolase [Pirellulaceae bacterium]|nr:alpha/beta hydrolase [Pirellulaceae bacterium]